MEATQNELRCKNCGGIANSKFCPECGQNTSVGIPGLVDLVHDGFAAFFSYDAKVWRTLRVLMSQPGQLTLDYLDGKRACYLSPFQLFFWLEAIAFLSHRVFFSKNPVEIDLKSKALLVVGLAVVFGLSVMNAGKRVKFVSHLIAGVHIWSFLMLLLLVEYMVIPGAFQILETRHLLRLDIDLGSSLTLISQIVMAVYMALSIRRVYTGNYGWAIFQTLILFALYKAVAFGFYSILT